MVCLVVVLSTTALPCLRESRSTLPPSSSSSSWTRGESGVGGGACVRSDREGGRRGGRVGDRAPSGVSAAAYLRVHVQDLHHVSDEVRELLVHLDLLHVLLHLLLVALQVEREAVALVPQDANLVLEQARAHGDVLHRRSLQLLEHPLGVPVVIEHAVEIHRARAREASAPRSGVPRGRRGDEAKANSNGNKKPTATDGMRGRAVGALALSAGRVQNSIGGKLRRAGPAPSVASLFSVIRPARDGDAASRVRRALRRLRFRGGLLGARRVHRCVRPPRPPARPPTRSPS